MNRNVLKIIALISMIIDHIGLVFFPEQIVFRLIGRLSFPIFAFFVAEGWYYTRSKKRYTLLMLIFMLISWVPYCMALDLPFYTVNVMGVFLLSILGMFLVDRIRLNNNKKVMYIASFCMLLLICFILEGLEIITMGVLGVVLPIVFYAYKEKPIARYIGAGLVLLVMALTIIATETIRFEAFRQFFGLVALIPIMCYNNNVGRYKLKYLFYITYPLHLIIIMLIKLI